MILGLYEFHNQHNKHKFSNDRFQTQEAILKNG